MGVSLSEFLLFNTLTEMLAEEYRATFFHVNSIQASNKMGTSLNAPVDIKNTTILNMVKPICRIKNHRYFKELFFIFKFEF
jgi:hypothetical protein